MSRTSRSGWQLAAWVAAIFASMVLAGQSSAQISSQPTIRVGPIGSEGSCALYEESAGSSSAIITRDAIGLSSSWQTWLVRDCIDNFASIRTSLEAALAASGKFLVGPKAAYVLTGRISDVGDTGGPAPYVPSTGSGYSISDRQLFASIDVTVRDASGRIIFGDLITKHIETNSSIAVRDGSGQFGTSTSRSGQAIYTELQHEIALAVSRRVSFHFAPLKVLGGDGRQIQLNYGSPLLAMGSIVEVTSPDGATTIRYLVTSASANRSTARIDGGGDFSRIIAGSMATVIEPDDPAANGRRYDRVDLP